VNRPPDGVVKLFAAVRRRSGAAGWALWTAHRYDGSGSTVNNRIHRILRQTGRAILLTVAFLYFLIDLIFSQSSDLYGGA
jgi:hypothetical protein